MLLTLGRKQVGYLLIIVGLLLAIVFGLVKVQYDSQAAFLCENIEASGGNMLTCPAHKTDTSWFFAIGFGLSLVIILVGIYLGFVQKQEKKIAKEKVMHPVDVSALDEESKKVYELIRQRKGSLFQSELVRETGYSKVRISRILDKLEHDNIIERKRRGMTNLVVLA